MEEPSLFDQVKEFKKNNPESEISDLQKHFPNKSFNTLKEYQRRINREKEQIIESLKKNYDPTTKTFRNQKEAEKKAKLPSKIPTFKEFVETEAIPKPIHRKTKEWIGLLDYEEEWYELIEKYDEIALLEPREFGKTWVVCWYIEYRMKYFGENFLYLSLTRIRFRVANWIYIWAYQQGLLADSQTKYSRVSTYHQFEFKNGARFEEHKYMSKDILGYHNWTIVLDDIVDKKWETYQAKQREAEEYYDYTLQWIGRNKLIIVNTCKFEGDLLQYIIEENKDTMHVDRRTPYRRCQCEKPNINDRGLYDYCEICDDKSLLAPSLHTQEELERKKQKNLFAWYAEMMQDPHPITGKVWSEIHTIREAKTPYVKHYDLFFIYIDRATTLKKSSDYTGCIMGLRERETSIRLITHDYTDHIPLENLLVLINEILADIKAKYNHMSCYLIIEKQGGGDDLLTMIKTRKSFEVGGSLTKNTIENHTIIIPISSTGNKRLRIQDRLHAPLINGKIMFVDNLRKSELVNEILTFPYCSKFDAIDALAMGDFEIQKIPLRVSGNPYEEVAQAFRNHSINQRKGQIAYDDTIFNNSTNKELENLKKGIRNRNKGIFG